MAEKELALCDECGSLFFKGSSQMMGLCPDGLLGVNRNVEPLQNVGHGCRDTFPCHRFDLAVVLVKLLLEIIDAADRLVQRFLHHLGVGFATLQQVDDLLKLVF